MPSSVLGPGACAGSGGDGDILPWSRKQALVLLECFQKTRVLGTFGRRKRGTQRSEDK